MACLGWVNPAPAFSGDPGIVAKAPAFFVSQEWQDAKNAYATRVDQTAARWGGIVWTRFTLIISFIRSTQEKMEEKLLKKNN